MGCDYVSDGYTAKGYIAEVPGLHKALRFQYRPMLAEDEAVLAEATKRLDARKAVLAYASAIATRLVSWSLVDEQGKAVPVTEYAVRHVGIPLHYKLRYIITGVSASDIDPEADATSQAAAVDADLQAAIAGTTTARIVEEADRKNS